MFNQVTILGPGLLGASLAKAIRKESLANSIRIWARRKTTLDSCIREKWCDQIEEDLIKSVHKSNLIIICTPVDSITEIITKIAPIMEQGALLTDVGSVKELICQVAKEAFAQSSGKFIGSHPMAGSEKSGMKFAHENLFQGRSCIVSKLDDQDKQEVEVISNFWEKIGMSVYELSPHEHDQAISFFSHLPHFLSSTLAKSLDQKPDKWKNISGMGLKDTTRIAEGDPELWKQIFLMNKDNILQAVEEWERSLNEIKLYLKDSNNEKIYTFLKDGMNFRKKL
jgi:prephenate dehydrogenase